MKCYSANEIRNVAILGHSGSGKTTLTEAMLFETNATKRFGKVDEGNTTSDYDAEEIKRKVSINTSVIPIEWLDSKINFLDTPGYFDFVGEVKEALAPADIALIMVSAKSGIEVGTEKAWEYADDLGMPKVFFVNGMDDENADLDRVLEQMRTVFGKSIAPLVVDFKDNDKFVGFVDAIKMEGVNFSSGKGAPCPIPEGMEDHIATIRSMLFEAVAETDDELMEKFFNEEEFTVDEIKAGLREGIKSGSVCPVLCGVASQGYGIKGLLDVLVKYIPPTSGIKPFTVGVDPKTNDKLVRKLDETEPFSAFVFKSIADPYVGRLNIFKVNSGVLKRDAQMYNIKKDGMEKVSRLYVLCGKNQIEVDELRAGDIGAIAKLNDTGTQDTLCTKGHPIIYDDIEFPPSLMTMAIQPKGKGDEDKISSSLNKLLEEDMTLKYEVNPETKQSLISGIGDMHLDVALNKLKNKYKIEVDLVPAIIPFREMIKSKVSVRGKHKKQSGGHGQYGDVLMEFEPSGDLSVPYVFEEKIFGGSVPRQYFPAVEKGLQECIGKGVLAGYPVVGLKATLVDGSYHDVDSSEMAFKLATTIAFKEGLAKAKPTLLEPIAHVEIVVPSDYTGDVMGDINKRRGRILGMDPYKKGKQKLIAEVPMSELAKYSIDLRSMTQGRGEYSLYFDRYEEAPADAQQKIIAARAKELGKE